MLILKDTAGKVLAKSNSALISIGREADNTACVNEEAVSGYHGLFILIGDRWIYRDNFSTNGSFFNGVALRPGQIKAVRHRDSIRLAAYTVQCNIEQNSLKPASTDEILILKGFEPIGTHPLPKDSNALIINSDLGINYQELGTALSFARSDVGALTVSCDKQVEINGLPHTGSLALLDQDQIDIGDYTILVCYSGFAIKPVRAAPENREYDPSKKMEVSGKRAIFGAENVVAPAKSSGGFRAEMSMSQRLSTIADDEAIQQKSRVEKTYAAFGVIVLFSSISFVVFAISLL